MESCVTTCAGREEDIALEKKTMRETEVAQTHEDIIVRGLLERQAGRRL